ncbi:MAG: malonyl-CoA decarboxylase family protein, partial [Burkholderiales bacterium]|nr:malonyl-CoA decarboxylase family protein [Burkholderiales bacterium]
MDASPEGTERPATPARQGAMRAFWNWLKSGGRPDRAALRDLGAGDLKALRTTLRECLAETGGEASARGRVHWIAATYRDLNDAGRRRFLQLLAGEFGPDEHAVRRAVEEYLRTPPGPARRHAESRLRLALGSPRIRVLKQFNLLSDGVKFLVDLRADVLGHVREAPELEVIDEELYSLLGSWFDVGNLELARITWNSPAALLEKLIAYEAVHEIRGWGDLRKRLDSDRRCYAFFHPRMPGEPLIFVEIALTRDMAAGVQALLDESAPVLDPQSAQAAVFYSISNTQLGLRGVSFGGFLIKRVVEQLLLEFPRLRTFATLSPMPGFRRWLDAEMKARRADLVGASDADRLCRTASTSDPYEALAELLRRDLAADAPAATALEPLLTRLAARYLAEASEPGGGRAQVVDPVARFHLGNGARLERVNWLGDTSPRGMRQSYGLMVNYQYKLDEIESNHEAYAREGKVAMSG